MPDYIRTDRRTRLQSVADELEAEGFVPGTPPYEATLRQRKIEVCQVLQEVPSCFECDAYDSCEMIKQHLREVHYGVEKK